VHPFRGLHHRAPIIVGGDLNDVYGTLGPKLLAPAGFRTGARRIVTFPAYAPMRALDGLYVRGDVRLAHLERSHHALARVASDHLPLVADVDLV
jgi:endonuclease/exonuclease/phosphatase family metal-dependent hydrolase